MLHVAIGSLASGSSGNCYVVASPTTTILVDAGISARRIRWGLSAFGLQVEALSGVLLTHEHSDHVAGLATLLRQQDFPVYANEGTFAGLGESVSAKRWRPFVTGEVYQVGDLSIRSFPTSHDCADPVGYSIERAGRRITLATDTGCISDRLIEEIKEADIIVLESNHDEHALRTGGYPAFLKRRIAGELGHLSNETAARALAGALAEEKRKGRSKPRHILLAHLSRQNNCPDVAVATMENILEEHGCPAGGDIQLTVLPGADISPLYTV